jgi:hypothetical protein
VSQIFVRRPRAALSSLLVSTIVLALACSKSDQSSSDTAASSTSSNAAPSAAKNDANTESAAQQDSTPKKPNLEEREEEATVNAEESVKRRLRDPESAHFGSINTFPQGDSGMVVVVCGYVNAKNGFGGYTGEERFVSIGGAGRPLLSSDGEDFATAWAQFCKVNGLTEYIARKK